MKRFLTLLALATGAMAQTQSYPPAPSSTTTFAPNTSVNTSPNLLTWRTALATAQTSANARAYMYWIGDSISAGSGPPNNYNSFVGQIYTRYQEYYGLNGPGFGSTLGSMSVSGCTKSGTFSNVLAGPYDTAVPFYQVQSAGGSATYTCSLSSASGLALAIAVYFYTDSTSSAATISLDGVSQGTFCGSTTSSYTLCSATVFTTTTGTSHSLVITFPASTGHANLWGVAHRFSGYNGVVLFNVSQPGAHSAAYGASSLNTSWLSGVIPGLVVIELGQNDGTSNIAGTVANINNIYMAAVAAGHSVMLMLAERPSSEDSCTSNPPTTYCYSDLYGAEYAWAVSNQVPVVDIYHRWGPTYAKANALGLYADTINPSQKGANDIAQAFYEVLSTPTPNVFHGGSVSPFDGIETPGYTMSPAGTNIPFLISGLNSPTLKIASTNASQNISVSILGDGSAQIFDGSGVNVGGTYSYFNASGNGSTIASGGFPTITTFTNCANGSSPASCSAAPSGAVAIPTGVNSTLVVNTTAVTANSRIILTPDSSVTIGGTTCNTTLATLAVAPVVTARTAGTSFTVSYNGTIATNPLCISYQIQN